MVTPRHVRRPPMMSLMPSSRSCRARASTITIISARAGRTVDVPACFIAGKSDWGSFQTPGVFEAMQTTRVCTQWRGAHLVDGAGHWVQQEQPDAVSKLLVQFLNG